MSLLKKLFGGSGKAQAEARPEDYNGYRIFPEPQKTEGGYRVGARIEKDVGGAVKVHRLVRADMVHGLDGAEALSIRKAKQVIDERGEALFN